MKLLNIFSLRFLESLLLIKSFGGKGGGSSEGQSFMKRAGSTTVTSGRSLPAPVNNLLHAGTSSGSNALVNSQNFLNGIVNRTDNNQGYPALKTTAAVSPYSDSYKSNTDEAFNNRVLDMLALARSGENNVLAPIGRGQALRESEVIRRMAGDRSEQLRQERATDTAAQQGATQLLAGNALQASGLMAPQLSSLGQAIQALASATAANTSTTVEDLQGWGQQAASGQSFGLEGGAAVPQCCWILLESYYGTMPWWVRECRDEFAPESTPRRLGYRRMARWLCPAMRKSKVVRWFVRQFMVLPLERWGGWYKEVPNHKFGWINWPVKVFWFKFWEITG